MLKSIKHGFTLAEVLTTLMVIGVVAAMTIPTLMNSTTDQQYKVAYKKAMSVLGQGIQLMTAREEECKVQTSHDLAVCMNKVISGSLVDYAGKAAGDDGTVVSTPDGLAYQFIYNGDKKGGDGDDKDDIKEYGDLERSLVDICGDSSMMSTKEADKEASYNGTKAKCLVVVDLNGTAKGAKEFVNKDATNGNAAALTDAGNLKGSEQQVILLTGAGVRPMYVEGQTGINKGYQYMYGDKATPFEEAKEE